LAAIAPRDEREELPEDEPDLLREVVPFLRPDAFPEDFARLFEAVEVFFLEAAAFDLPPDFFAGVADLLLVDVLDFAAADLLLLPDLDLAAADLLRVAVVFFFVEDEDAFFAVEVDFFFVPEALLRADEPELFLAVEEDEPEDFREGTFPPSFLASESPMAIACLRLFTVLPELPDFSWPLFISCIAFSTLS